MFRDHWTDKVDIVYLLSLKLLFVILMLFLNAFKQVMYFPVDWPHCLIYNICHLFVLISL